MSNLFHDHGFRPQFTKIASPVRLSDNSDQWQMEIGSELFKQLPFLSEYAVNVILERISPERGFAFGSAEVTNKTESPPQFAPQKFVRIPVIVRDRLMMPADIMMINGKAKALNEQRLREELMRADTFELTTRKPPDQGIVDQLYPPLRTNYGYGNAVATGVGAGGFGKYASLTEIIAPTVTDEEVNIFIKKLGSDRELALMTERNSVFKKLAFAFVGAPRVGVEKTAEALVNGIRPTVVQLQKLASGNFRLRWANREAFLLKEAEVPPEQAGQMAGADLGNVPPGGTITVSTEKAKKESLVEENYEKVDKFGFYQVHNAESGEVLEGWVLPVIDLEMQPLELFVWTNGQGVYSVQDEIAGARRAGDGEQSLPSSPPQGDGVFYFEDPQGARALLPMTIRNQETDPEGGASFVCDTVFHETVTLTLTPGLEAINELGPNHYAIPAGCKWLSLPNPIHLVKTPEEIQQGAQNQNFGSQVEMKGTGPDEVSLEGQPLAKMAAATCRFLKHADAEFLLVAMGANPFTVREKLAQLDQGYTIKLAGLRPITPLAQLHDEMVKKAAEQLRSFNYELRCDLIKEAAALEDAETADKILAVNFINPENVAIFASYLPQLDQASEKLAELLLAARLGMSQVDEGAVERAMKNLETVIAGLKELQTQTDQNGN